MAVISLGGTVVSTSLKVAGDDFDEAIVRYMKKKHNLLIGDRTAEDIKIKIGTTYPLIENEAMEDQWTESGYRTAKDSYGDFGRDRTGTSGNIQPDY